MVKPFTHIDKALANSIRLIMTDVDGTLLAKGNTVSGEVAGALDALQKAGIVVGLVSGRTLPVLEKMAEELGLCGPVIAENGGIARLFPGSETMELGYSREPALEALAKLNRLYPGAIRGREDNEERTVDFVLWADGIKLDEIRDVIKPAQLLDSGYILHLMQEGISKGQTLLKVLDALNKKGYTRDNVMIFGDSVTDVSLFELFPNSVLVVNPGLPEGQAEIVMKKAAYLSEHEYGEGFVETALHIIGLLDKELLQR